MSVPEGFKQTEVGVIPKDWEAVSFSDVIISTHLGGNYQTNSIDNGFPLIKMGNLGRGNIVLSKIEFIALPINISERDRLEYGDVLFNTRNTLELVGKVAIWRNDLPIAYFNSNIMRICFDSRKIGSNFFMNYILNSTGLVSQLKTIAIGTTSVAAIYSRDLFKIKIPLPSTKAEQTAIAAALSDMDALIEGVEKLLEKKRRIKQGAMQELLKPKEGWKEVQLDSVADIDNDNLSSSSDANFTFQYISLEDVDNGFLKGTTEMMFKDAPSRARRRVKQGDVLISTVRPNLKSHLLIKENLKNYICSTGFSLVRCYKEKLSSDYLFNHLFASYINRQIETVISGSNYPAINTSHIKSLKIPIPARIEEQEEIAAILSDMDSEIEQLETQLAKYRQLKTGMMQELLTGKKRLV
jgi:type I restriction enzyme S subunit